MCTVYAAFVNWAGSPQAEHISTCMRARAHTCTYAEMGGKVMCLLHASRTHGHTHNHTYDPTHIFAATRLRRGRPHVTHDQTTHTHTYTHTHLQQRVGDGEGHMSHTHTHTHTHTYTLTAPRSRQGRPRANSQWGWWPGCLFPSWCS